MNYKKYYEKIINNAKNRNLEPNLYFEKHHIIPKCMNGEDSEQNIVKLTAKEHYVVHHLLIKIYKNTEYFSKLICAFRFMSVDSHNGNRIGLEDYDYMRKIFSENHPMKNKEISNKTSIGLKEYYKKLSPEEKQKINEQNSKSLEKYYSGLSDDEYKILKEKLKKSIKNYFDNETEEQRQKRLEKQKKVHTDESYKKTSKSMKKFIDDLTEEDKNKRLINSLRSCDNKKRGESISNGKKGKKTNQQQIMGEKYANMNDLEFNEFLKSKSPKMYNRIINLRNKYLKGN